MSEDINRSIRIYLNTTDATKKYDELTASTERLTQKLNELQREGKANGVEFKKVKAQLDSNIKQQARMAKWGINASRDGRWYANSIWLSV